jgi:hypothetical protein
MPVTNSKAERMGGIMIDLLGVDLAKRLVKQLLTVKDLTKSERESLHRINEYLSS